LLGSDADSEHSDVDADAKIIVKSAISSQNVTLMNIYSSMDAAIILYAMRQKKGTNFLLYASLLILDRNW